MGKLLPIFAVTIILSNGFFIFRDQDEPYKGNVVIPCYIFLFSLFLLLCEMRIYPKSLRKLGRLGQTIIEYFIATFIMENLLTDFWIPLETQLLIGLAKLSVQLEETLQSFDIVCGAVCDVLGSEMAGLAARTILSLFFLLAVLQATRAIDFGQLRCGVGFFFTDILFRLKWYFKRTVMRSIGFGNKRRVRITGVDGCRQRTSRPRLPCPDPCKDSEDCHSYPDNNEMCDDDLQHTFSDFEMTLNEDCLW
ncbi:hypothetical protein NQ314_000859 [Rhamnusium bicolor]|uniref:Uncharacterized protein n=1 Tax=Rhamnusium bicolor TaxID=1586634 RepID=A0AAV8ZVW2_9CUCU|nr:hypothetical protein NQ314_000859 [Rhamnusium bicolor]